MKQIWIDYCKEFGITLEFFKFYNLSYEEKLNYVVWLEDKCKENQKEITRLNTFFDEEN